jgi:hypothetical protein
MSVDAPSAITLSQLVALLDDGTLVDVEVFWLERWYLIRL